MVSKHVTRAIRARASRAWTTARSTDDIDCANVIAACSKCVNYCSTQAMPDEVKMNADDTAPGARHG
jgi:hypothetical protein